MTNLNPSGFAATTSGSGHHSHGAGNHKNNKSNSQPPPTSSPLPPTHSIQICCAWDDKLAGGELTYKIVGGDNSAHQAVKAAINAWTTKLSGLKFTEISGMTNSADIMISFNNNGKSSVSNLATVKGSHRVDTVGQTMTTVSSTGLISNAVTTVSEGAFGSPFSKAQLKQIAMHEIGHALGIGHANFKGDLMSPMLNNEIGTISQCDVRAVLAANQWKLGAAGLIPEAPKVDQIAC